MRKSVLLLSSLFFVLSVSTLVYAKARDYESIFSAGYGSGNIQAVPRQDPPPPPRTLPPSGGSSGGSDPDRGSAGKRTGENNRGRDRDNSPVNGRAIPRSQPPRVYIQRDPIYFGYGQNLCWPRSYYDRNYYGYDPRCDPYFWRHPHSSPRIRYVYSPGNSRPAVPEAPVMGSIRLRVNPKTASVLINGVLMGIVDEFDGLTNHLKLEPGLYQLEIRADGYKVFSKELRVVGGKTVTERATLQKVQKK